MHLLDMQTSGAPMLIQAGAADNITPPALCQNLVTQLRKQNPGLDIEFVVYPEAGHAFDNPTPGFSWIGSARIVGPNPSSCFVDETETNSFQERTTGRNIRGTDFRETLLACSGTAGEVRYDGNAREQSLDKLRIFLTRTLLTTRPEKATVATE